MEQFHFLKLDKIHQDSIRSITTFKIHGMTKMITVSRDSEAKVFNIDHQGLIDFQTEFTFFLPTQISTVCVLDREDLPQIMYIFGCLNGHVYLFHGYDQNAFQSVSLHTNNVCIIRSDIAQNFIASGSWDHTAIIFKMEHGKLKKLLQITGHMESVMDLMFIGSDRLLTASSDRSIVLWNIDTPSVGGIQLKSFMGHEDCVRGLLMNQNGDGFFSISNDQTIRFWNIETGMCLQTFIGHDHFIFDINRLSSEYFITCGENYAVLIWNESKTQPWQRLKLPTVTIWSVLATNSNVFYAAGSDGILYIFTNHPDLKPDSQMQSLYDEMLVKQTKIPFASVAHLKIYEENSLLTIPPKGDGDRRLIRSMADDTILVYEWNGSWKPIGFVSDYNQQQQQLIDVDQSTGRVPYNDEFYDEVFNVKLNAKNYKLPFNRDENPWLVAQKFIEQNQLDYGALTSLVQCIVKYASYKPKHADDSYSYNYFPIFEFKLWPQVPKLEAFRKKFIELNEQVNEELRLSPEHLQASTGELENPEPFVAEFCEALEKLLKWPPKVKFIVYDLLRVLLVNKYFNTYFVRQLESKSFINDPPILDLLVRCDNSDEMNMQLTSLRVLANLFASVHGAEFMFNQFSFVKNNIIKWKDLCQNLNVHLSYSSIWFNYSVLLADWKKKQNQQLKQGIMEKLQEHASLEIEMEKYDKVILELMNTFGNLIASKYSTPATEAYLRLLKTYPQKYMDNSDIRHRLRQIEMISIAED